MRFEQDDTGEDFFALTTYRRDGTPVSTPVWMAPADGRWYVYTASRSGKAKRIARDGRVQVAPADGRWYVYTASRSGKAKRIARDGRVQVAPSDFRGEAMGPSWPATARLLPGSQLRTATSALSAKYGAKFRFFRLVSWFGRWRRRGGPSVGLEITPAS
ncbi:pyridoxamine 5'-phosphate oxidase family protein [Ruania albidiflava]|uniref:pyridoxamine 5'-phosphate oxidase family protein n=1 Tax=Ruania albidiflava TaxID=366586 RepID=UPI0003B668EE|nr:pyridoxamine 5'-phosphate oxidase family protein [Ruania albidiflava]